MTLLTFYNSFDLPLKPVASFVYLDVMSYLCPRVPFLPGSKMTLFTFYNYYDLPLIFEFVIATSHVFPKVRFLLDS